MPDWGPAERPTDEGRPNASGELILAPHWPYNSPCLSPSSAQ